MAGFPPFGDLLRHARRIAGLSQEVLAERAGISARGISDLERGINQVPQRETVLRLADALALTGEVRDAFNTAAQRRGSDANPTATTTSGLRLTLPTPPLTALLGRDSEVAFLTEILRNPRVRLVTLTGPGGVGKTRLALAVAAAVAEAFPDGVGMVSLASLDDPDLVLSVLAQRTGLRVEGSRSLAERLAAHLRTKRLPGSFNSRGRETEEGKGLPGMGGQTTTGARQIIGNDQPARCCVGGRNGRCQGWSAAGRRQREGGGRAVATTGGAAASGRGATGGGVSGRLRQVSAHGR